MADPTQLVDIAGACPHCGSQQIYQTVVTRETEVVVSWQRDGDGLIPWDTKSEMVHEQELVSGEYECEHHHVFAAPVEVGQ